MLDRARSFNADIIMYDLEDSVPPNEKINARNMAKEWVPELRNAGRRVMVRCNALDTGLTHEEISAVVSPNLYGISVGKTESEWDIKEIDEIIAAAERTAGLDIGTIKLIPWIESAKAVRNVDGMSTASPRTVAIAFGGEDYTNDMGVQRTDHGEEVYVRPDSLDADDHPRSPHALRAPRSWLWPRWDRRSHRHRRRDTTASLD